MKIRQAPSGPEIVGNNAGDVLVWSPPNDWVPGPLVGGSAFDHVVESLADLPAPAAGVITLTSGSWAFKAPVDVGANVVRVPSGTTVLLKGMAGFNQKALSGSDSRVLLIEGSCYAETLTVAAAAASGGAAVELATNASLTSRSCYFNGDTQGVTMSAGLWRDSLSRISGGTEAMVLTGGALNLSQTRFLAGTEAALAATGASVTDVFLQGCQLSASAQTTVRLDCSAGNFYFLDSELECSSAGSPCMLALLALSLQLQGGRITGDAGAPGIGLEIDGNITRHLQLLGVQGFSLSSLLTRTSGTVRQATIGGCSTFSDVAVGVTWAAANIPTNGLALVGNTFDTATPLSGFAATDARVNSKANIASTGLMSETAIVP